MENYEQYFDQKSIALIKKSIKVSVGNYTGHCAQIDLGSGKEENVLVVQAKDPYGYELSAMELERKRGV